MNRLIPATLAYAAVCAMGLFFGYACGFHFPSPEAGSTSLVTMVIAGFTALIVYHPPFGA